MPCEAKGAAAPPETIVVSRPARLGLYLLAFAICMLLTSTRAPSGDAYNYAIATRSLVRFGTLDATPTGYGINDHERLTRDGKNYTIFPLGQSLIQVPAFALMQPLRAVLPADAALRDLLDIIGLRLTPALLAAALLTMLFTLLVERFGFGRAAAAFFTFAFYAGTLLFNYAQLNYTEVPQSALLFAALLLLAGPRYAPWHLPLAAGLLGLLVPIKPVLLALVPFALLPAAWDQGRAMLRQLSWQTCRTALLAAGCFLLGPAITFYWNYVRTGSLLDFYGPTQNIENSFSLRYLPESLYTLWVEPHALWLFNPLWPLALLGTVYRPLWPAGTLYFRRAALIVSLAAMLLFGCFRQGTSWGSAAFGPRFMVPFLILWAPGFALLGRALWQWAPLAGWRRSVRRLALAASALLVAGSVALQSISAQYPWTHWVQICGYHDMIAKSNALPWSCPAYLPLYPWLYFYQPDAQDLSNPAPLPWLDARQAASVPFTKALLGIFAKAPRFWESNYLLAVLLKGGPYPPAAGPLYGGVFVALLLLGLRLLSKTPRPAAKLVKRR